MTRNPAVGCTTLSPGCKRCFSDLFHERIPFQYVRRVFDVMARSPRHTFQVLTKRARRMAAFCAGETVPENVWLGVSVENRRYGLPRIAHLRGIDAPVRFLSIEPLLEDLGKFDLSGRCVVRRRRKTLEERQRPALCRPGVGRDACMVIDVPGPHQSASR